MTAISGIFLVKCQKQAFSFNKREVKMYCNAFLHVFKRDTCIKHEKNILKKEITHQSTKPFFRYRFIFWQKVFDKEVRYSFLAMTAQQMLGEGQVYVTSRWALDADIRC
jgi:hypothetical protein